MKDPIDSIAEGTARLIKQANPDETIEEEVMSYALALTLNMVLTTACILLIGFLLDKLTLTLQALGIFAILRITAKGAHLKSLSLCVIATTLIMSAIILVRWPIAIIVPVSILCMVLVLLRSKVSLLRKASACLIILAVIAAHSGALIMACLFQAVTLIPKRR